MKETTYTVKYTANFSAPIQWENILTPEEESYITSNLGRQLTEEIDREVIEQLCKMVQQNIYNDYQRAMEVVKLPT